MNDRSREGCVVIRKDEARQSQQGLPYFEGISAENAGASGICMHLVTIPPGGRARAHLHEKHETAIYVLSGMAEMWYGERLQDYVALQAGEFLYIPAGMPHLPANPGEEPCTAVIARTDASEQESVHLLPELDALYEAGGLPPGQSRK